jgi:hypothetical protein
MYAADSGGSCRLSGRAARGSGPFPRCLLAAVLVAVLLPRETVAADLDAVLDATRNNLDVARASQQKVDTIVDETEQLETEYLQAIRQLDGLQEYNRYMEQQIASQERELESLARSLDEIENVERQILPLMLRMLDALEQFIELDVPFLKTERQNRVAGLRTLMARADVSAAEKFRRLLEAFQIEVDFGRTIETYKDTPTIDGTKLEVDMLRLGRVGLFYQTSDASRTGMWDQRNGSWVALEARFRNPVRQGIRMARRQLAPDLLVLPVPAPESAP